MAIMEDPASRGRPSEIGDKRHLSVSSPTTRARSVSVASSRTNVEEVADIGNNPGVFKRRQTQVPVVNLSRWDCFKGFFGVFGGIKKVKQVLAATVEIVDLAEPENDPFDHNECPFVLTVSVYECYPSRSRQSARCVIDTACLQGNIISADFARRLGFTSFGPLQHKEHNGGRVATGGIHTVIGAVRISWFHSTAAKVFRDMRFLVSETAEVDLVLGTHSIVKHRILLPPNLMVRSTATDHKARLKLATDEMQVKTKFEDLEETHDKGSNEYKQMEKEYKIAKWRLELFDAKKARDEEEAKKTKKSQGKLDALKSNIAMIEANLKEAGFEESEQADKKIEKVDKRIEKSDNKK